MHEKSNFLPQTARRGPAESAAIFEQISIQVQTDISLQTLWKRFQHAVHVDTICIRPRVLHSNVETGNHRYDTSVMTHLEKELAKLVSR